ncbi:hypothetical protein Plhal304r1_c024g0083731 [Plasmopara halstedii]
MGNQLNCLAKCQARREDMQRLLILQKGAYFMRKKTMLGITTGTEKICVRLDEDRHTLMWNSHDSSKSPTNIELRTVSSIRAQAGNTGLIISSQKGDILLDVEAESKELRDTWVTSLQLCKDGGSEIEIEEEVKSGSKFRNLVEDHAKKQVYWAKRAQELEKRKQEAEERKKKFSGVGMKYTALAMSNRPNPSDKT